MSKIMTCPTHGETEFSLRKDGRWRCKKCASEYVTNKRKKQKEELVLYKGGKCEICGYEKCIDALEFHHLDPTKKDFVISGYGKSIKKMKEEVDKCILVCANCHREIHSLSKNKIPEHRIVKKIDSIDFSVVQQLQEKGYTQKEIAKEIGVSLSTLKRFLTKMK